MLPHDQQLGEALLVPTDIVSKPYPSISMVPIATTIRFDRRTLAGETKDAVLGAIEGCLRDAGITDFTLAVTSRSVTTYTGEAATPSRWLPAWRLSSDHTLLRQAVAAVEATGQVPTVGTWRFCTNGSESAGRRRIPTIGLGPGCEEDAHTIDESIAIEQLEAACEIYCRLALLAAGEAADA